MSPEQSRGVEVPVSATVNDISAIDSRLGELYRDAVGGDGETATPTIRTALFNLIIYADTENLANKAMQDAGAIVSTHPSRVIVVDKTASAPDEESTVVSLICGITERGERRLCGEVIRVHMHNNGSLTGSVMPLLVSDTPVYLWILPCEIPEDGGLEEILLISDLVFVDSRQFTDLGKEYGIIARLLSSECIIDLAWISLLQWRELTAQHFDPPAIRKYIAEIDEITVQYNPVGGLLSSAALLFACWLIDRTGLRVRSAFSRSNGIDIEANQDDRLARISLVANNELSAGNSLVSVTIRCSGENGPATFFTQAASDAEIAMGEECAGLCLPPKVVEVTFESDADLISCALDNRKSDEIYESALAVAMNVLLSFAS